MYNKITTKQGDSGFSILRGKKVHKSSDIMQFLGQLDIINSYIGICVSHKCSKKEELYQIQNVLFDIGASFADESITFNEKRTQALENWSENLSEKLPELKTFILPGGAEVSSHIHVARSMVRHAESIFWKIHQESKSIKINISIGIYLNRLSDFLFILARYENNGNDVLWKQGFRDE